MPFRAARAVLAAFLLPLASLAAQGAPRHPLDGLSSRELWTVYDAIRGSGRGDSTTAFGLVQLAEPPKAEVLGWRPGQPLRRKALASLRHQGKAVEATVDLASGRVVDWREIPGVQTIWTGIDWEAGGALLKGDSTMRAALARRGVTDLTTITCWAGPPGYFDLPEQRGRRIGRGGCTSRHGTYNTWGRQFEGLIAYVDLDAKKVLRVVDHGPVPLPPDHHDYDPEALGPLAGLPTPIVVTQPEGASFAVDGGQVTWGRWTFHVRLDQRMGTVVSLARFRDGDRDRSVLYQGSLAEIFVPYMDPAEGWYDRNFLDTGEYSHEGLAAELERGTDCPDYAFFLDMAVADAQGVPHPAPRRACLFERTAGDVAWRHGARETGVQSRPKRDLVLRMSAVLGNYDYILDWVFQQDGAIRVAVGATGIMEVKGTAGAMVALDQGGRAAAGEDRYGRFVARNVVAVNHDHFFNYRLDLDVDGPDNSLLVGRLVREDLPPDHPRRSVWRVDEAPARTESEAMLHMSMERPAVWRVASAATRGPLGYPTSYEIKPEHNAMPLLAPDDWPQRRAGFTEHTLWVTPYRPDERYAAGPYPTLSTGPAGLPVWTQANRAIAGTDIVAWYTLGFHHVPRAEDWPVMPTAWHSFELRPFDFFPGNPVLRSAKTP